MSQRYPYRSSSGDYKSHEDAFPNSYQRDSDIYRPRDRLTPQESLHPTSSSSGATDSTVLVPGKALSFLHSCGLDASDLSLLADLPEHLITVETLPQLLLQIKERKLSNTSSSRSSTTQEVNDTSSHAWESSSHGDVVEYPVAQSARSSFPLPPEQVQSWQDRWGNPRKTGFAASTSATPTSTSHQASNVRDYGHSSEGTLYYDEQPYTSATPRTSSTASHSYDKYNNGNTQKLEPLHHISSDPVFKVPTWKEASDFNGILPPGFPYTCVLCNASVQSERDWSAHVKGSKHANNQRRMVKQYPKWNRSIDSATRNESAHQPKSTEDPVYNVPTRKEASDFYGRNPPVFPYPCVLCNVTALSLKEWSIHVTSVTHASSQLKLLEKYPNWDQSFESARRNEVTSTVTTTAEPFVKRDPVYKVPTRKEASNFRGRIPSVFPASCVLCDFTVLSRKDWTVHIRSAQHANSQLELVEKYPEWDQQIVSARRDESQVPAIKTTDNTGGTTKEKPKKRPKKEETPKPTVNSHGKVVSVKFGPNEVEEEYLTKLLGQFGKVVKVMMFPTLALVEMGSKEQSDDVVKYFIDNPLAVQEKPVEFSVSTAFSVLQNYRVVSFNPLPAGDGASSELLAIARRFGSVKNSSFLPNRGYVEMTNAADAQKLVDYYSDKPLKLKGTTIQITLSSEYDTLDSSTIDKALSRSSPRRHSSRRDSPSPKRRRSSERTRSLERASSSRSSRSKDRDRPRQSTERSKTSSKKPSVSSGTSAKDQATKSSTDTGTKKMVSNDNTADVHSDSDVEGLEVIADDGEELLHDDHEPTEHQKMDQDQKTGKAAHLNNKTSSTTAVLSNQSLSVTVGKVKDSANHREKTDISVSSSNPKKDKASEGQACDAIDEEEEDPDFPYNLENCITLDELEEEASSDGEQNSSVEKPEGTLKDVVAETETSPTNATVVDSEDNEQQPESAKDKSICQTDAEIKSLEVTETVNLPGPTSFMEDGKQQPELPKDKIISTTDAEIKSSAVTETVECPTVASLTNTEDSKQPEAPEDTNISGTTAKTRSPEDTSIKDTADQSAGLWEGEKGTDRMKEIFGKVLHIGNFPKAEDYTDSDFINVAKRYGEVKHYCLVRSRNKGFVEMVHASDAERITADAKNQDIAFRGNVLKIKVSETYSSLPATGFNLDSASDGEEEESSERANSKESADDNQDVAEVEPLNEPNKPNEPVGTEFVRPVVGYFCNLCNVIYASEEEAKDEHCRSSSHHERVKEHKMKSGSA